MYFRQVFVQSFKSLLVLVFKSLVELMVPVLTPCPHVIRPVTLNTHLCMSYRIIYPVILHEGLWQSYTFF